MSGTDKLNEKMAAMRKVPQIIDAAAEEVGAYLTDTIFRRVRLGYGVGEHGQRKEKFRALAPSTIEHRTRLSLIGELHPDSKPNRSHLTMTGQMMDSLTYRTEPGRVILYFNNQFAENKAYWNNEGGRSIRPFFYLTDLDIKATKRTLQKYLDEYIEGLAATL